MACFFYLCVAVLLKNANFAFVENDEVMENKEHEYQMQLFEGRR